MEVEEGGNPQKAPHVLIFPFPLQGHVNSMLKLAELLCVAGINITFLVSENVHSRLLLHSDVHRRLSLHPGMFQFKTYSDGLPQDDPRSGHSFLAYILLCLRTTIKEFFLDCTLSLTTASLGPPTCIISDGAMSFVLEVGEERGIPVIYFRTIDASCFWCYFSLPQLIDSGELPFQGTDLDLPIENVTGMEGLLRRRDLPSICRGDINSNTSFQSIMKETLQTPRAWGVILNTFEDLEGPVLRQIRTQMPNVYTIGPLHAHSRMRVAATKKDVVSSASNSLWKEDRSCMPWIDSQPDNSVIYVSFGSLTVLTREQLVEFWHGLVGSGKGFLWVIRPESVVDGDSRVPTELEVGTRERGHIVGWAPQEEVLGHRAVGAFLTHSGWNSTLESIDKGLPMICWPYFLDQQVNSRLVERSWELGLDMKDICDRSVVKRLIHELMDVRRDEFKRRAQHFAKLSHKAITKGGSSYSNLDRLIGDIRSMMSPH